MENVVGIRVQIHPVALFTIVDSYERRQELSRRVIGPSSWRERAGGTRWAMPYLTMKQKRR